MTAEEIFKDLIREKKTRIRVLALRLPAERETEYHSGVEVVIPTGGSSALAIELNALELRAWGEQMIAWANEIDSH